MRVRFIRQYLHHSLGDVVQFDVETAKRLISLGIAVLHAEAGFFAPPDPVVEDVKEMVPPQDKMVRSSSTKGTKKKTKKRGRPRKAATQG